MNATPFAVRPVPGPRRFAPWASGLLSLALTSSLTLLAAVAPAAEPPRSVILSELQADPQGLADLTGERSGWVELLNTSDSAVHLAGWFLTDDRTNPTKWRFPDVVLLPDKSLVVHTSGHNQTANPAALHASFQLDPKGGYLALVGRHTNVVSEFSPSYPPLRPGTSFGRVRGEPAITTVFKRPTPGKPNSSAGAGFAPGVRFSRPAGTFTEPFTLELAADKPGADDGPAAPAVLRYTFDGTLPHQTSPPYAGPLVISNTAHLRVRAYQEGRAPGPPASVVYIKLFSNVVDFSSSLPVLVLDTLGPRAEISSRMSFAHLQVFEPVHGRTSLTNPPSLVTRAGYRVRGSTSADMPQSGFAVECLDEFNGERSVPLLGLPADSDWILYAPNAYDPVLIHNPFVHQLSRDLGRYSPRTRFVEMFVVNGAGRLRATYYHGLHVLEEKIKIGRNRVNIDRLEAGDLTFPSVTGGYLLKFDRLGPDEGGAHSVGDRPVVYVEPREQTLLLPQRLAQRRYINGCLQEFERILDGPDWKDPAKGYPAYLDVDAAIDFHVLELLSGNVDSLVLSTYWHKPRGGKITFGPHWDFDRALGSTDGRDEDPQNWNTGPFFNGPWWDRLFTDVDFWQRWVDRWQDLRESHFAQTNLNRLADALAAEIREAQPRQYQRWGFQPRGGSYASELAHMKEWLGSRTEFIDRQLVPPPRPVRPAGSTNLLAFEYPTNVTVFYTLDGSDPRAAQGSLSSNALPYAGPFLLAGPGPVVARARNASQRQRGGPPRSTPWSGPVSLPPPRP